MQSLIETIFWLLFGILALFYSIYFSLMVISAKRGRGIKKAHVIPRLSLVIPVHNECEGIVKKLENSVRLNYPKDRLEILVVDDGSTDNTYQLVENFLQNNSTQIDIRLIALPKWSGKASALNYAWTQCTGEIVAMTDADITLEEDAIQKIVRNFSDPKVGAVTGRLCVTANGMSSTTVSEKNYRSIFDIIRLGESQIDSTPIFNGLIMAFRRELLDNLDSSIIADDTELAMLFREKGWKAIYDPEVIAYEFVSENQKLRAKQKMRRGRGIVQSFMRHRKILFNRKYGKYGLVIFPCEFFMHIISPVLMVMMITTLIPLVVVYSLLLSTSTLVSIATIASLFIVALALILTIHERVFPSKRTIVNPISIFATFLTHEVYLIVILFSCFLRYIHIIKKSKDIRNTWQTKTD